MEQQAYAGSADEAQAGESLTQPGANAAEAGRGLAVLQVAVAEFDRVEAGLEDLRRKYLNVVFDVRTAEGMEAAKAARLDCRTPRYAVANALKSFKAEANRTKKTQEERAEKITDVIVEVESPIDAQIKAEETRVADEKAAKALAAEKANAMIQGAIDAIRNAPAHAAGKTAAEIFEIRGSVAETEVTLDGFGERAGEATQAQAMTLVALNSMYDGAVAMETVAAQVAAQRAELEAMQAKADAEKKAAEEKRIADEAAERERVAAANKKAAEELAAQREAFAKEQAEARAKQKSEDDRLQHARAMLEEAERAERDRKERDERAERQRLDQIEREFEQEQIRLSNESARIKREADDKAAQEKRAEEKRALDEQKAEQEAQHAADQKGRAVWRELMQVCIDAVQLIYTGTGLESGQISIDGLAAAQLVRDAREVIKAAGGGVS